MLITIETKGRKFLAIPVPMDAKDFTVNDYGCIEFMNNGFLAQIIPGTLNFYARPDNCTILGYATQTEVSFECEGLVEGKDFSALKKIVMLDFEGADVHYKNYLWIKEPENYPEYGCANPTDSFLSLLKSNLPPYDKVVVVEILKT